MRGPLSGYCQGASILNICQHLSSLSHVAATNGAKICLHVCNLDRVIEWSNLTLKKLSWKLQQKPAEKLHMQTKICIAFSFKCCSGDIFHISRLLSKPTNHKTTITDVPWLQIKSHIPDISVNFEHILMYDLKRFYL